MDSTADASFIILAIYNRIEEHIESNFKLDTYNPFWVIVCSVVIHACIPHACHVMHILVQLTYILILKFSFYNIIKKADSIYALCVTTNVCR